MDIFLWFLVGSIGGAIAFTKGHRGFLWFLFGPWFGPITLVLSLFISTKPGSTLAKRKLAVTTKKCPTCAEDIRLEALKCKFCGEVFDASTVAELVRKRQARIIHGHAKS